MIVIAWQSLRARSASFVGSFVALTLGVGLFATAGLILAAALRGPDEPPRWYQAPSVVVAGPDRAGTATTDPFLPPGERGFIPTGVIAALSGIDDVIVEYVSYARFGAATEAHPWAASALHPFRFLAGGPPDDAGDVVLTAPTDARLGEIVTVATADGPRRLTVSGIIDTPALPALYVSDDLAARLADHRIAAVALLSPPGRDPATLAAEVGAALHGFPALRVLTGDDRRGAEPDAEAGLYIAAMSLAGSIAGLSGFVAVYIVAGTFTFTVTQRRREFALLRAAGATPRQVRRLVLLEAILVGVLAGLAGIGLSVVGAPPAASWLTDNGLAPSGFGTEVVWWPLAAAFVLGLTVAVVGAWLAARRAGAIRPVEAIGEAEVERRRTMTATRWVLGLACLGGVVPVAGLMSGPAGAAYLLLVVILLIVGGTLLLPVLMAPINRLTTTGQGPVAVLARASVRSERRRYAATIAPVLVTVGLAGGALAGTTTISATEAAALRQHLTAPVMINPAGEAPDIDQLRDRPGVIAAARVKSTSAFDSLDDASREHRAWYIDGAAAPHVLRLPLLAGSLVALTGDTVAVSASMAADHGWRLGRTASLRLGDGAPVEPRIVAVVDDRLGLPEVFLPWTLARAHAATPVPDAIYLALAPHTDPAAIEPVGGTVTATASYLDTLDAQFDRLNRLALLAIMGMALVYTAIAIANTQLIATGDRAKELLVLRKIGATRRQVLRLVGREALTVVTTSTVLGGAITAATLVAVHASLATVTDSVSTRVPWLPILGVVACCAAITFTASLTQAYRALLSTAKD
jgi:putative ABC transport system permease protein